MNGKLVLAIPSKGRLQEKANAFFADAGAPVQQKGGGRDYTGALKGIPDIEVTFLAAQEIATALAGGAVHLGITGEDLLRETAPELPGVRLLKPLGFGHADVVVAVPRAWIDVQAMADLDDVCLAFHDRHGRRLRFATKYVNLTRAFFAERGITEYRIVESFGATEGAPAAGTAEAIVDITSTGATLAANNLKVVRDGVILRSQAQLAASLAAPWGPAARAAARHLLDLVEARARAKEMQIVRTRIAGDSDALMAHLERAFGCIVQSRPAAGQGEFALLTPREHLYAVVRALDAARGGATVSAVSADYLFAAKNALYEGLEAALG